VTNPEGPIRNEPQGNHVSWIVRILPYLEENALFQRFDQQAGAYAAVNREARTTPIETLFCPSAYDPSTTNENIVLNSYVGCHHDVEAPIDDDNHGLLFLNSKIRYADILDGSSKTILLGEALIGPNSLGWASGTRATLRNTGSFEFGDYSRAAGNAGDPLDPLFVGGFGSYHAGDVGLFGLADGSVRVFSRYTDPEIFQLLGHRADGELMKSF
jgi:hypothetical protein